MSIQLQQQQNKPPLQELIQHWETNWDKVQQAVQKIHGCIQLSFEGEMGIKSEKIKPGNEGYTFVFKTLKPTDDALIAQIVNVANSPEMLSKIVPEGIKKLAELGLATVVLDGKANVVSAYLGAEYLTPEEVAELQLSGLPIAEIRTSFTIPEYQGNGLNTFLKKLQAIKLFAKYNLIPTAFTDDIPEVTLQTGETIPAIQSQSMHINQSLAMVRYFVKDVIAAFPERLHPMTDPCPAHCSYRYESQPQCGCSLWFTTPEDMLKWANDLYNLLLCEG